MGQDRTAGAFPSGKPRRWAPSAAARSRGRWQGQTLVGAAGAVFSLGIGIAWKRDFAPLHCDNSSTGRLVQSTNQRIMPGVNYSTMPAPSASCLVARAAGKPSCWPMGTQRDLGWAQIRPRDWPSHSRAFSRNRYAASPSLPLSVTGTAKRDMILQGCMQHRHPRKSHSQRAATQRRLHQSASHSPGTAHAQAISLTNKRLYVA